MSDPDGNRWSIRLLYRLFGGVRPDLYGFDAVALDGQRVDGTAMRRFPVAQLRDEHCPDPAALAEWHTDALVSGADFTPVEELIIRGRARLTAERDSGETPRSGGRPRLSDEQIQQVAESYLRACSSTDPKKRNRVRQVVAEELKLNKSTAARQIAEAKRRGFIPEGVGPQRRRRRKR